MIILGIETSCDETAVAIVRDGREVLSSIVHSQVARHRPYGGVVPEIASRCHVEALPSMLEQAKADAGIGWQDIDAIAATRGPGLAPALIVGWSAAKGLSAVLAKPLIPINHLEAHIYSAFLACGEKRSKVEGGKVEGEPVSLPPSTFPPSTFIALVVSGGHTSLYRCNGFRSCELLGRTIDDAAGEALDKAAKLLGLPYPGGPVIDRLSTGIAPTLPHPFPTGQVRATSRHLGGLNPEWCFSFSGLKTALRTHLLAHPLSPDEIGNEASPRLCQLAADYQEAVVTALAHRCRLLLAAEARRTASRPTLVLGGGVSLNRRLREALATLCHALPATLHLPAPAYCGDNAAMIAGLAFHAPRVAAPEALDILPAWPI